MKRCDNCGWYNPDTLDKCEKCGETLPEISEQENSEPSSESLEPGFTPAHPLSETEPKPTPDQRRRRSSNAGFAATMMRAGEMFDTDNKEKVVPGTCPKCHYPLVGNPVTCPNCGATLGRNTRQDASHAEASPKPAPNGMMSTIREGSPMAAKAIVGAAPASFGKATIRDIPKSLRDDLQAAPQTPVTPPASQPEPDNPAPKVDLDTDTFRLVPLTDQKAPVIYMRIGDVIAIEGKRYRVVR